MFGKIAGNLAPSNRKAQGYSDAFRGKVSLSEDKFYRQGYENGHQRRQVRQQASQTR